MYNVTHIGDKMDIFQQFGITQAMLEVFVFAVAIAVLFALYWRTILIGCTGVFALWVFLNHQVIAKNIEQVENKVEQAVTQSPIVKNEKEIVNKFHEEFMQDCMDVAANEQEECEDIWYDREEHKKEAERQERTAKKDYRKDTI
jgi:uncharacterized membrane protein